MQDNESSQRRTALRFSTHDLYVTLGNSPSLIREADQKFKVGDASPEGCSILITEDEMRRQIPTYATGVYLTFSNNNTFQSNNSLKAHLVYSGPLQCGFRWASYLRPERLGPFTSLSVNPCDHYRSTRQRHKLQEVVALKDLDALTGTITNLRTCQFQLILAALPIFVGLLGAAFFIIGHRKDRKHHGGR